MLNIQPDTSLPGFEILLDPHALANRIRSWLGPGELTLTNIRYKPGTSCLVSYELRQQGADIVRLHAKAFEPDDWLVRRKKINEPALRDEELSLAVFRFPHDAELAALEQFTSRPELFLSRILLEKFRDLSFQNFRILASKPNRRFVAQLNFNNGEPLVLKLHDGSTFQSALRSARALKKLSFSAVAVRAGMSNKHRALAFEWIPGTPLNMALMDSVLRESTMQLVFDYLHQLHRPVNTRKIKLKVRRPEEAIREIVSDFGGICPSLASLSQSIADDLLGKVPGVSAPQLVHGDFHERQLIIQTNGIGVCDFDNCCVDDSTVDLANFVAHLHLQACLTQLPAEVADAVDAQCLRHIGRTQENEMPGRYQWNKAASLLRLVTHAFRSGSNDWMDQTESLLRRAQESISQFNAARSSCGVRLELRQESPKDQVPSATMAELRDAICGDTKFDFLARIFDEDFSTKMLNKHLRKMHDEIGEFTVDKVLPRRHKTGRRCLIEFELADAGGSRSLLGKASAKRLDRKALQTQRRLFRDHGFDYGCADGICVPKTVGYCEPWNMWFQEKIDAVSAGTLMDGGRFKLFVDRIAPAIAKLHQCSLKPKRGFSIADELDILDGRLSPMMVALPEDASRIEMILNRCRAMAESISSDIQVPVHRDFYQDQIMFADDQTFLVDLDLVSLGHPALDIGNFFAHLTEHGIRTKNDAEFWKSAATKIVDDTLALNPACTRMEIEIFKLISFARHIFISWSMADRRHATHRILDHAEELFNHARGRESCSDSTKSSGNIIARKRRSTPSLIPKS